MREKSMNRWICILTFELRFSQESLMYLKFRDALAQIMKEIREFHGLHQIPGLKIGS
jgi:hypothetical protein